MSYEVPKSASNFRSTRLVFTPQRIKKIYTWQNYLFGGIFILMGMIPAACGFREAAPQKYMLIIVGCLFVVAGIAALIYKLTRKCAEIDLEEKAFYPEGKGKDPLNVERVPLPELEKLHIQSREIKGKDSNYMCYTLYLVFRNRGEYILLDHGDLKGFLEDAEKLSKVLGKELPEHSLREEKKKRDCEGGGFLLVFGRIWFLFSSIMGFQAGKQFLQKGDYAPLLFLLPFMLVGIFLTGYGIKLLRDKKKYNEGKK